MKRVFFLFLFFSKGCAKQLLPNSHYKDEAETPKKGEVLTDDLLSLPEDPSPSVCPEKITGLY